MTQQTTHDRLIALRLNAMAAAYLAQQQNADFAALSFDERLALLVEAEHLARDNRRLTARLREAKLKMSQAAIEAIDYPVRRELDRSVIRQMATCDWVGAHQGVIITGMTGVGKTYVACALAQQACRRGFRVYYRRMPRFFDELALARADGTYSTLLAKLARFDVLVLDDVFLTSPNDRERRDLLEVMEDRFGQRSTILTSQVAPSGWHDMIADPTLADAICERMLMNTHRIALKGPSRRKNEAENAE